LGKFRGQWYYDWNTWFYLSRGDTICSLPASSCTDPSTSSQTIQIQGQYQTKETCEQYSYCDIDYTITNPDQCSGKMGCSNYCQYCTAPWWSSTTGACFAKTNFKVASYFDPDFWTAYDDANTKCSALGTDAHPTQLDWSTFNCSYTNVASSEDCLAIDKSNTWATCDQYSPRTATATLINRRLVAILTTTTARQNWSAKPPDTAPISGW